MGKPVIIEGGLFVDKRGSISFVNDFDFQAVKRFYVITHPTTDIIRAWQGHKEEKKWFFCSKGSFLVLLVKIGNWENPSKELKPIPFQLIANKPQVLAVPPGYVNGFKALEKSSTLIVFSDKDIESSKKDDFRFDKNLWYNWEKI